MDKRTFKSSFLSLLEQGVIGLTSEEKIKYMKKWIRDYELKHSNLSVTLDPQDSIKVGTLVQTTIRKIIKAQLLSDERVRLLQESRYCKTTFDINYPFLKKVEKSIPLTEQRKINGYDRYWKDGVIIHHERYLICNDWYDRNKQKFLSWVREIENEVKRCSR